MVKLKEQLRNWIKLYSWNFLFLTVMHCKIIFLYMHCYTPCCVGYVKASCSITQYVYNLSFHFGKFVFWVYQVHAPFYHVCLLVYQLRLSVCQVPLVELAGAPTDARVWHRPLQVRFVTLPSAFTSLPSEFSILPSAFYHFTKCVLSL